LLFKEEEKVKKLAEISLLNGGGEFVVSPFLTYFAWQMSFLGTILFTTDFERKNESFKREGGEHQFLVFERI
jgi:hypothetical protein